MKISYLPKQQKKLIRLICAIQIRNLGALEDPCDMESIEMFRDAEDAGLDVESMKRNINSSFDRFLEVHSDPRLFILVLSDAERSTFKHIMHKFIKHPKYENSKRALWNKFRLSEHPLITYN